MPPLPPFFPLAPPFPVPLLFVGGGAPFLSSSAAAKAQSAMRSTGGFVAKHRLQAKQALLVPNVAAFPLPARQSAQVQVRANFAAVSFTGGAFPLPFAASFLPVACCDFPKDDIPSMSTTAPFTAC